MADGIAKFRNPWRDIILSAPASFAGIIFHVENGGRASGRRTVVHEYPKRDDPYAEDMGKAAVRFQFSGYLIYRPDNPFYEYTAQRVRLYNALESSSGGKLVHPVFAPGGIDAQCERYSMSETRERGGYTQFEMAFVEVGKAVAAQGFAGSTASLVLSTAQAVMNQATTSFNLVNGGPNL